MLGSYTIEDDSVFVSQSTQIWGNVRFGSQSSTWFSTIFRSSQGFIEIGRNSHINDQTRIINSQDSPMRIGDDVYVGGQCSLSDCNIGDACYIGERSIIYPGTIIPPGSFIAPNSMVVSQTVFPENSFIQGSPASSTGYVVAEMRREYCESLSRMQKEVSLFRSRQPQAEQSYFLIHFSVANQHSERVLRALWQVGAGEFLNYSEYCQTVDHAVEYRTNKQAAGIYQLSDNGYVGKSVRQELMHSVTCPSHKLQDAINALCQNHPKKPAPMYQVTPIYFQLPPDTPHFDMSSAEHLQS